MAGKKPEPKKPAGRQQNTVKIDAFLEALKTSPNATDAARKAGYSDAKRTAWRLKNDPKVKPRIEKIQREAAERNNLSQDWILQTLQENVERAMQALQPLDKEGDPVGEYKYEGAVANKALELLGKHLGMFTDKLAVTGANGGPLVTKIVIGDADDTATD